MSDNIRKRGDTYYYDLMIDNKRYRGSTKTTDKKLAQSIADTIKADIIRKKHGLQSAINYNFVDVWDNYIASQLIGAKNNERKIIAAKHFLPVFKNKSIQSITADQIENYRLKRKLEVINLPKNSGKRESEISFRSVNIEIATLYNFFNFCIKKGYLFRKEPRFRY